MKSSPPGLCPEPHSLPPQAAEGAGFCRTLQSHPSKQEQTNATQGLVFSSLFSERTEPFYNLFFSTWRSFRIRK